MNDDDDQPGEKYGEICAAIACTILGGLFGALILFGTTGGFQ